MDKKEKNIKKSLIRAIKSVRNKFAALHNVREGRDLANIETFKPITGKLDAIIERQNQGGTSFKKLTDSSTNMDFDIEQEGPEQEDGHEDPEPDIEIPEFMERNQLEFHDDGGVDEPAQSAYLSRKTKQKVKGSSKKTKLIQRKSRTIVPLSEKKAKRVLKKYDTIRRNKLLNESIVDNAARGLPVNIPEERQRTVYDYIRRNAKRISEKYPNLDDARSSESSVDYGEEPPAAVSRAVSPQELDPNVAGTSGSSAQQKKAAKRTEADVIVVSSGEEDDDQRTPPPTSPFGVYLRTRARRYVNKSSKKKLKNRPSLRDLLVEVQQPGTRRRRRPRKSAIDRPSPIVKRKKELKPVKQPKRINQPKNGKGMIPSDLMRYDRNEHVRYTYWDDPNELVDRLRLLMASQAAGHTGHTNEIISIIEELRESKIVV